jgi:hypothetical protein
MKLVLKKKIKKKNAFQVKKIQNQKLKNPQKL